MPVHARRQRLDLDRDFLRGIFGKLGARREDDRERLADIADIVRSDDRLSKRRDRRILAAERDRRNWLGNIGRRDDGMDAGHGLRRRRIDFDDAPEGDLTADDRRVPLAVTFEVADILALAAKKAQILHALDRPPDIGVDGSHPAFGPCFLA